MAASVLGRRTALFCWRFTANCSLKTNLPVTSPCGALQQVANYNAKRLWLNLKDPYIPDKESDKTPEWRKTAKADRKLYGRYGSVSGIDPATLWPSEAQLAAIVEDEKQWHPPLEVLLENVAVKEKEETAQRLAREKIIAENMAKMPKMIADWRREKREAKQKLREDKARKARLLAEARERFGYAIDPRSPKFVEMIAEIEKEEKKKKKLLKRRQREEQAAGIIQPAASS